MPLNFSVEFFPPQKDLLNETCDAIQTYLNNFPINKISITHGATGHNKDKSLTFIEEILNKGIIEPHNIVAHLSCAGLNQDEVLKYTQKFYDFGIRNILVIKGDSNGVSSANEYKSSEHAMVDIKKMLPQINILAACFPEPRQNINEIQVLENKILAGTQGFISQFCFEKDALEKFYKDLYENEIKTEITVGVIIPTVQTLNFAKKCNAYVSEKLLEIAKDEQQSHDFILNQLHNIEEIGYKSVHLYSLNKLDFIKILQKYFK